MIFLLCNITTCVIGRFRSKSILPWFCQILLLSLAGQDGGHIHKCDSAPVYQELGMRDSRMGKKKGIRGSMKAAISACWCRILQREGKICAQIERDYMHQSVSLDMNMQSNHQCKLVANKICDFPFT